MVEALAPQVDSRGPSSERAAGLFDPLKSRLMLGDPILHLQAG